MYYFCNLGGKTTLARLLSQSFSWFKEFSATIHSIQDIKNACLELRQLNGKGVIFVDEIHRFNKLQQDIFLSGVESGEYTLIGATTENPSFRLNNALLSRCRVFVLNRLETKDIVEILLRTVKNQNQADKISDEMLNRIASVCDGDARIALNTLDVLLQHGNPTLKVCQEIIQKTHLLHDKKGDDHYGMISALHKSVRGSDENAALYWLGRMLYAGDDPLYIARRMIRMASEDIGIANNNALALALTTYQALQVVGMPESDVILAHCCTVLCRSPKSVQVYKAMKKVKATVETEPSYPIPMHLRPASTALNADMGYGKGYMYNPDYDEPVEQDYLPIQLRKRTFFEE
jgi:putative ATPase